MNSVKQLDQMGCGAACVSFVSGKDYKYIISLLGETKARNSGYSCKDLVNILLQLSFSYTYRYLKPHLKNRIYKNNIIVFIKRSKRYPNGHYLVRCNGFWMDSWINFCKDNNIDNAKSGFRKRLPGKAIYALFPEKHFHSS